MKLARKQNGIPRLWFAIHARRKMNAVRILGTQLRRAVGVSQLLQDLRKTTDRTTHEIDSIAQLL